MSFQIIAYRPSILPFTIPLSASTEETALDEGDTILSDVNYPITFPLAMWNVVSGEVFSVARVIDTYTSLERRTDNYSIFINGNEYSIPSSGSIGSNSYHFFGRLEDPEDAEDDTYNISDTSTKMSRVFKLPVNTASVTAALSQIEIMRMSLPAMSYYRPHLVIDSGNRTAYRVGRTGGSLFLSMKPTSNLLGYLTPPSDIDNYY